MMSLWWKQIVAVMRLEIKKTFFARRGLWIYLLALAPVVLFIGEALAQRNFHFWQPQVPSNGHVITQDEMDSIQGKMTREQIVAKLGEPSSSRKIRRLRFNEEGRRVPVDIEDLHYYGERISLTLELYDDVLKNKMQTQRLTLGQSAYLFATAFEFFYIPLAVFFGCLGIFMNLFRGEMLDKSLHYYLLSIWLALDLNGY